MYRSRWLNHINEWCSYWSRLLLLSKGSWYTQCVHSMASLKLSSQDHIALVKQVFCLSGFLHVCLWIEEHLITFSFQVELHDIMLPL